MDELSPPPDTGETYGSTLETVLTLVAAVVFAAGFAWLLFWAVTTS